MEKIYSRKRIKLPVVSFSKLPMSKRDVRKRQIFEIILILIIAIIFMIIIIRAISPIIDKICKDESKRKATMISNQKSTEVMANYTYSDMVTIYRDNEDNITMLKSNIIVINEIISDVAVKIQEELQRDNESTMYLKLRKLHRNQNSIRSGT